MENYKGLEVNNEVEVWKCVKKCLISKSGSVE